MLLREKYPVQKWWRRARPFSLAAKTLRQYVNIGNAYVALLIVSHAA